MEKWQLIVLGIVLGVSLGLLGISLYKHNHP